MFKIESYITPIIINYIDKYVKDFRPQNAQVSLWGGEVSFQNLDIRLDLLQQELHLPLNIVSGHIHELTIRIPWTKIASEPIQININTIEFVVKLKSENAENATRKDVEIVPKIPANQEPPGYMATLINKIANNISIKLNNIIFKYIEEDIVMSMNIQLLSYDSADNNWQPAFNDINPTKVVLKKVINVTDLTICLDKRNAQGKIDVCQEPILYRCSLQARMIRKYNLSTAHLSSSTRIDIFTDFIDFKVSVQQYPMLIRMYLLIQLLRESRINVRVRHRKTGESGNEIMDGISDGSYVTWMWNMLPELFPKDEEDEETDSQGHIFHSGFYARKVNITLKSQEMVSSSIIHSTTSIKYHPFLKITLYGLYFDAVSIGRSWYNLKGGISYIGIFPVGICTCGKKHNLPTIFVSGKKLKDNENTFLADSLKDPECCENNDLNRIYNRDHEAYFYVNTTDYLLKKSSALAFDVVSYRYFLDDAKTFASQSVSEMDFNGTTEEYRVRSVFGPFNFKFDISLIHMWKTLNEHYEQYYYSAPYLKTASDEITLAQLTPPSTEDFDSLVQSIPLRRYEFTFKKPQIEVYFIDADHLQNKISNDSMKPPYFVLNFDHVELTMTSPLYPNKLIHTTCQLPNPPEKLKSNCFWKLNAALNNLLVEVVHTKERFTALTVSNFKGDYETLLKPDFWKLIQLPLCVWHVRIPTLTFSFTKPQFIILNLLAETFVNGDFSLLAKNMKTIYADKSTTSQLPIVELSFEAVHASATTVDHILGINGLCRTVCGKVFQSLNTSATGVSGIHKVLFLSKETPERDVLNFTMQIPNDVTKILQPPIFYIKLDKIVLTMDAMLQSFLNYRLVWENNNSDANVTNLDEKTASRKQWSRKSSRVIRSINRTESVHSNSAATLLTVNSAKLKTKESEGFVKWYNLIKCLVLYCDIMPLSIFCPNTITQDATQRDISDASYSIFRFPSVLIQTTKFKYCSTGTQTFPISIAGNTWSREKSGFPWNIELNNFSCSTIQKSSEQIFLTPVNTTITLDITDKLKESENIRDEISFVIHLDTMPIEFNFTASQLENIYRSAIMLYTCFNWPYRTKTNQIIETPAPPTTLFDTQISDFIAETTNSERSSEEVVAESDSSQSKFNLLVQWTITKLAVNMLGYKNSDEIKVSIELEDIISSVDKQSAYMKLKMKCGSMTGYREKRKISSHGRPLDVDILTILSRSHTLVDNSQETIFELVATKATTHNVHNRWGARKVNLGRVNDDTITEVMITIQSLDVKLELEILSTVLSIVNSVSRVSNGNEQIEGYSDHHTGHRLSVKQLPLIFFNCKGFQMWLPTSPNVDHSDVLILKMNSVTIAHTVDNPIQRKPVREDIYTKACQLRIINTPGSEIEDRQYEILFKNISVGTGNWKEILNFTQPSSGNFELNPAFDWNNQTQKPALNLNTIFEEFVMSVIFAPSIVFQNILVCGQAIEINCVNDLHMKATLSDLALINSLANDIRNISNIVASTTQLKHLPDARSKCVKSKESPTRPSSRQKPQKPQIPKFLQESERSEHDSGFKSHSKKEELIDNGYETGVQPPFTLSFVGGYFTVKFYKSLGDKNDENVLIEPMFLLSVMQPNFLISACANEYSRQFSIFNITISLFDKDQYDESKDEFSELIFYTNVGQLDESGIPPGLIYMKSTITQPSNEVHLVCNLKKPIKLRLTPNTLEKLFNIRDQISRVVMAETDSVAEPIPLKPINRNNKIKIMKKQLLDASSIDLSMDKTDICFLTPNSCALNFSFLKFGIKLSIQDIPQRLSMLTTIDSLLISSDYSTILHPMTARVKCSLTHSKWNKQLSTNLEFDSDFINFQICPNDVMAIAKTQREFLVCISRGFATFAVVDIDEEKMDNVKSITGSPTAKKQDDVIQIATPAPAECPDHYIEEHFQDDLRMGAFQYIETTSCDSLPLAYQIHISPNDKDLKICWRYPHPRIISNIQVYPVPLQLSVNINCQLEYYLEAQNSFIPLCSFQIDEKLSRKLSLPNRRVTASVWRIVIFNPVTKSTEPNLENYNVFVDMIQPRALVGCIRIDSIFSNKNIPMIQLNVNIKNASLSVLNSLNLANNKIPPILKQYALKINSHLANTQEYCCVQFPSIMANVCMYSATNWTLYNEFTVGVSVFDYSYLQMERMLENVTIQAYVENTSTKQCGIHVCSFLVDRIQLKYGPHIGHTIAISDEIWREIFKSDDSKSYIPILTRFVVSNDTSVPFKFGQHETEEEIWLRPNECYFYAFYSTKKKQKLSISVDCDSDTRDHATGVFAVSEKEELQYIPINNEKMLIVSQKKISTTQTHIRIKGQIEVKNMCKQAFQIHYKNNSMMRVETEDGQSNLNSQCVILLNTEASGSFYATSNPDTDHIIRLHLAGSDGSGWSGEIPLHAAMSNVPWLVKVPTKNSQKFASFSVRIHKEFIDNRNGISTKQQRLLIVIWPLFTARSFLPHRLIACDMEYDRHYALRGKGERDELQLAGTFDTDHEFLFNLDTHPSSSNENWKTFLSYKSTDRKLLFTIPERLKTIDDINAELEKPDEVKWPCSNYEECLLDRPISEHKWALPLYKFSPSHDFSCSLLLDILPWCLFINSLGCEIKIINSTDGNNYSIESNHIGTPFMITTAFTISVNFESGWKNSCLIYINDCKPVHRSQLYYKLPQEGSILIELLTNSGLSKFQLTSKFENNTRVITVAPYFVVCNLSRHSLKIHPFCVSRNEKLTFHPQPDIRWSLQTLDLPMNPKSTTRLCKGIGITSFQSLSHIPLIEAVTERSLNYFVVISIDEEDFSVPILINKPITRTAFGLRYEINKNSAFALSAIEYLGQIYITVYDDRYPFVLIENRTNIPMFLAEPESSDITKHSKPRRSIHDENFQWYREVPQFKQAYYSPPSVNENFPDKSISNICLMLGCENKLIENANLQWSFPIKIDECAEKFLNMPLHGDLKLTFSRSSKTIHILVEHINVRTEFNVKNILTKLSRPASVSQSNDELYVTEQHLNSIDGNEYESTIISRTVPEASCQKSPLLCINADIFIKRITITLYAEDKHSSHEKKEIVSLYVDDLAAFYEISGQILEISLGNIQLDNNLFTSGNFDFPVVLCGRKAFGESEVDITSLFEITKSKSNLLQRNLVYFKFVLDEQSFSPDEINCNIKPFTAYVEDKFIAEILDFFIENLPTNIVYSSTSNHAERISCEPGHIIVPRVLAEQILSLLTDPLRISRVLISPVSILLSVHTCMRFYIALDHSPLDFSQFEVKDLYTTSMKLGYNVGMHYVSGAIFGAGWVVGSLEILGSPSGFARSVSTGLWDFVSLPVQGLFRGPWGFLLGLTQGSASLLKNVTAGTVNSVTKLAASFARNLDRLTLDEEHLQRTEALRRSRPQGITHGFTQGLTGFGINLLGAVGGIARHALEAKSSVEVFTGIGKGLVGAVTKPISGAAELLALTGQGVLQSVGFNTMPIPRPIKHAAEPSAMSATKILWKISTDPLKFVTLATASMTVDSGTVRPVSVALTSKLIIVISIDTNSVIEMFPINEIVVLLDEKNPSAVILAKADSSEGNQEYEFYYNRILQYVTKSHEQLGITKTLDETTPPVVGNQNEKTNRKVTLQMEQNVANYFIKYVQLVNYSSKH